MEALRLPIYYNAYLRTKDLPLRESVFGQEFFVYAGQICLYLLAAAVLLGRTDKLITLILTGQWRLPAKVEKDKD